MKCKALIEFDLIGAGGTTRHFAVGQEVDDLTPEQIAKLVRGPRVHIEVLPEAPAAQPAGEPEQQPEGEQQQAPDGQVINQEEAESMNEAPAAQPAGRKGGRR